MGQGAWSSISLTSAPSPLVQTRGQLTFVGCKEGAEALRWIGRGRGGGGAGKGELKGHFSTLGQSNKARCSPSQVNYHEDLLNIKELVLGCYGGLGKRSWLDGRKLSSLLVISCF